MAQEFYPVSKRLAKKLENYLQEMQDQALQHKRHFGRYFEAIRRVSPRSAVPWTKKNTG